MNETIWILFSDRKQHRFANRIPYPNIHDIPADCHSARLVIPDAFQDRHGERCSPEEARAAFRQGWLEAGGEPAECDSFMKTVLKPELLDDSDIPF